MDKLIQIPIWYVIIAILWSTYQGIRGIIEHNRGYKDRKQSWNTLEKWVILFVHDFVFRFICTISGFVALYLIYILYWDKDTIQNLTAGSSVFIVFLTLIGIIGIGGQLHYIILMGKWPK